MLPQQIILAELDPRLTLDLPLVQPDTDDALTWWLLALPESWLVINGETGLLRVIRCPTVDTQLVQEVIFDVVRQYATEPEIIEMGVGLTPDHVSWHVGQDIPVHIRQRWDEASKICQKGGESPSKYTEIEQLNEVELYLEGEVEVIPAYEFEGIFVAIADNYRHYEQTAAFSEQEMNRTQDRTPWASFEYRRDG